MKNSLLSPSRRKALKIIGLSAVTASALIATTDSVTIIPEDVQGEIIIVGGGAGALMMLARLQRTISDPHITIIAPNETHLYQPGQVFIGAGEMGIEDIQLDNRNYIDESKVRWIKDEVKRFDPQNNQLATRGGQRLTYDYLIVATGAQYHYEKIKGLSIEDIGTNGISSVYLSDLEKGTAQGAIDTWAWFQALKESAKEGKPKVLYTQPNTKIKCGGTPQKILYLSADYLKKEGLVAEYIFATPEKALFHLPSVATALQEVQSRYDTITNHYQYYLQSIDVANKRATFLHAYEKEVYDEEFGESEMVSYADTVVIDYDFIHITPPMSAVDAVVNSPLADDRGWLDVDPITLQHKQFSNIFGIGDTCGIPMGKTGGSARHQAPIIVRNLISLMKKESLHAKFDGYTVCPIKTQYGKILMAEFNYEGEAPTIPLLSIDEPRSLWWMFDRYQLKMIYQYMMMTGRF
jgi:sulfide:quinone oxidoreductase